MMLVIIRSFLWKSSWSWSKDAAPNLKSLNQISNHLDDEEERTDDKGSKK
jgi:hypothetical protein